MKNIFILWITFQLIIISYCVVTIHNQIVDKTYICSTETKIPTDFAILMPLAAFVPEMSELIEYCHK